MKSNTKIIEAVLLSILLTFVIAACGNSDTPATEAPPVIPAAATPEPINEPTSAPTPEPTTEPDNGNGEDPSSDDGMPQVVPAPIPPPLDEADYVHAFYASTFVDGAGVDVEIPEDITHLIMLGESISDLTVLIGLDNLRSLIASNVLQREDFRVIEDISPLSKLLYLDYLNLSHQLIKDISPLRGLTNLVELDLSGNQINDITPLYGLSNLRTLSVADNPLTQEQLSDLQAALPSTMIFFTKFDG